MLISIPFPDKESKEHKEEDNSSTVIHQSKKNLGLDTDRVFQPALVFNVVHFRFSFNKYNKHAPMCSSHAMTRTVSALRNKSNTAATCIELFHYLDFFTLTLHFALLSVFLKSTGIFCWKVSTRGKKAILTPNISKRLFLLPSFCSNPRSTQQWGFQAQRPLLGAFETQQILNLNVC